MRLKESLPAFYLEVTELLRTRRSDLLSQLPDLFITGRCKCGQADCSTFSVEGGRSPFNLEEQADRGPYLSDAIDLDAETGMVVVDIDHLGRIKSFEILNRFDVYQKLGELFPA